MTQSQSEAQERVEQRAQYERFSITVCANGIVNIRNDSYGDDSGVHIYSVNPTEGLVRVLTTFTDK